MDACRRHGCTGVVMYCMLANAQLSWAHSGLEDRILEVVDAAAICGGKQLIKMLAMRRGIDARYHTPSDVR